MTANNDTLNELYLQISGKKFHYKEQGNSPEKCRNILHEPFLDISIKINLSDIIILRQVKETKQVRCGTEYG